MAKVDPPTDPSRQARTRLETVDTWLVVALAIGTAAVAGYELLSDSAHRLSILTALAIGLAALGVAVSLLSLYLGRKFARRATENLITLTDKVTNQQLLQRLNLERTAAQTALTTTEALRAVRDAIPTELIQSIVDVTLNQRLQNPLFPQESEELNRTLQERVPIRVRPRN